MAGPERVCRVRLGFFGTSAARAGARAGMPEPQQGGCGGGSGIPGGEHKWAKTTIPDVHRGLGGFSSLLVSSFFPVLTTKTAA